MPLSFSFKSAGDGDALLNALDFAVSPYCFFHHRRTSSFGEDDNHTCMPLVESQSSLLASGTRIFTGAARRQHTPWRHSETG